MGLSRTNIPPPPPRQSEVTAWLSELGRRAYTSPAENGCIIVCDEECEQQDPDVIADRAADLSGAFECPALAAVVHDSDILFLQLFQGGERTMDYNSAPAYFEDREPEP